jgi:hypothetical protein
MSEETVEIKTAVVSEGTPDWDGYEEGVCERTTRVVIAAFSGPQAPTLTREGATPYQSESWGSVPLGFAVLYKTEGEPWETTGVWGVGGRGVTVPVLDALNLAAVERIGKEALSAACWQLALEGLCEAGLIGKGVAPGEA